MAHARFSKIISRGFIEIALIVLLILPITALSQTAVVPPGEGTFASPYLISEIGHLVWMSGNAVGSSGKYYTMTADIDASATATWNDAGTDTSILEGFKPIGPYGISFRGIFDGGGHTITGLVINRPTTDVVGLFGCIDKSGDVQNLGIIDGTVNGKSYVGGLAGRNIGKVSNAHVNSAVTGYDGVGGIVGENLSGNVSNACATGQAMGNSAVGGLVGYNSYNSTVSNAYATGMATGEYYIGGLIGNNYFGKVLNSYATGAVAASTAYVGGLAGYNSGTVSNSYWDTQTSGCSISAGGTGKTTAQMKQQATFVGWDFSNVWIINENVSYPCLRSLLKSGDADVDGRVNVVDLGILATNYGLSGKSWFEGDFSNDGTVNVIDLGILATHYGEGIGSSAGNVSDIAKIFDSTADGEKTETTSPLCSGLGLSLIAGLLLASLFCGGIKIRE